MAQEGFEERFRECLGSEEFEEKIDTFMKRKASLVLQESELNEGKDDTDGFKGGEFSLKAHSLWKQYLEIIEEHMTEFQKNEGLNDRQFKNAVEEVGERHPFLVKLMIASWEFPQFIEMCREYVNDHDDCYEEKSEGKGGSKYDDDDGKDEK